MPARLLVVDDEKDIYSVLSQGLKNAGYEIDSFTNPEEALSKFASGRYALAFTSSLSSLTFTCCDRICFLYVPSDTIFK
jgi:CheY-like chemotaxis protein